MGTHQLMIYSLSSLQLLSGDIAKGGIMFAAIVLFEIPVIILLERYFPFCIGGNLKRHKKYIK